ncbi:MAG: pectate lyase [Myxococcales bacterium]|nr:pectate lyase [Myxococcales bacterium]
MRIYIKNLYKKPHSCTAVLPILLAAQVASANTVIIQENSPGFCDMEGSIDSNHSGFSGTGFVNTNNSSGSGIEWGIQGEAGEYTIVWQFANGSTDNRTAVLMANGQQQTSIDFNGTGTWASWSPSSVSVNLESGFKTLRLEANQGSGLANIDSIQITGPNIVPSCSPGDAEPGPEPAPAPEPNPAPSSSDTLTIQENSSGFCDVEGAIESNHSGFNGSGFANSDNASGAGIEWNISGAAGRYELTWRYANGSGTNRSAAVSINGSSVGSRDFIATGAWSAWSTTSLSLDLAAGEKRIRLAANQGSGLANIDSLEVTGPGVSGTSCGTQNPEPDPEPSPGPDPEPGPVPTDAKALLKSLHSNSKFRSYVDNEIGDPIVMSTGNGRDMTVNQPIVVPPGATFDGRNRTFTPGRNLGGGSQDEDQLPVFILTPGASLVNTVIGSPGVEGVHMMGDNTLDNVNWPNVGEDAASVRSYFPGGRILIQNGTARDASDKVFQFNTVCDVTIRNFTARNMGKLVRQNGGTTFRLDITVDNVTATGVSDAGIRSDSPNCSVRERNFSVSGSSKYRGKCKVTRF